jgi:uncharacterized circularly permuted ATP-grasp superfamily protein/uncharacterized alpha-E superfamily protein
LGFYDEFLDAKGQPREPWQTFAGQIRQFSVEDFEKRERQMRRIIRDNGITFNVYSENESNSRPWVMDALPLILSGEEWKRLEKALSQRVQLLNLIYKDLYGPQRTLREGYLPASLVLGNPAFLHACHGWAHQPEFPIHFHAADLARSPNGNWWVLSDRLEAASGLGYALENRFISTRIFPSLYRNVGTQHLQQFVTNLCASYQALAPHNKDNPRVVLLTPGPANETYFEQSFLARNLGYSLVEGADLTVRDNRVFLKTINGMQQVDVIIRRVDAAWCDPLELNNESLLGIPGLVDVLRAGNVAISNTLGTGLLETTALPAFLPRLCRFLMDEELLLPSVATWWCGHPNECSFVIEHLPRLVLKSALRGRTGQTIFGSTLSEDGLRRWRQRILEKPEDFCAQEMVAEATAPVFKKGSLESRHFMLRTFMTRSITGWDLMPGGLARIASQSFSAIVSMQQGGESKDVWVLPLKADTAEGSEDVLVHHADAPPIVRNDSLDLPSRVAENLFWLGRYAERTEMLCRVMHMVLDGMLEDAGGSNAWLTLKPFLSFFMQRPLIDGIRNADTFMADISKELSNLIRDRRNPDSLIANFSSLQMAASKVKERLSTHTWQQLSRISALMSVTTTNRAILDEETSMLIRETLDVLSAFSGLSMENMTRGQSWHFLDLGRRMERAISLVRLIEGTLERKTQNEEEVLRKLLICADSSMTYRRRYLNQVHIQSVLDLLLFESANPRSLTFQLNSIRESLSHMPHVAASVSHNELDSLALRAYSRLGLLELSAVSVTDAAQRRRQLTTFARQMLEDLQTLAAKLENVYFAHTGSQFSRTPLSFVR